MQTRSTTRKLVNASGAGSSVSNDPSARDAARHTGNDIPNDVKSNKSKNKVKATPSKDMKIVTSEVKRRRSQRLLTGDEKTAKTEEEVMKKTSTESQCTGKKGVPRSSKPKRITPKKNVGAGAKLEVSKDEEKDVESPPKEKKRKIEVVAEDKPKEKLQVSNDTKVELGSFANEEKIDEEIEVKIQPLDIGCSICTLRTAKTGENEDPSEPEKPGETAELEKEKVDSENEGKNEEKNEVDPSIQEKVTEVEVDQSIQEKVTEVEVDPSIQEKVTKVEVDPSIQEKVTEVEDDPSIQEKVTEVEDDPSIQEKVTEVEDETTGKKLEEENRSEDEEEEEVASTSQPTNLAEKNPTEVQKIILRGCDVTIEKLPDDVLNSMRNKRPEIVGSRSEIKKNGKKQMKGSFKKVILNEKNYIPLNSSGATKFCAVDIQKLKKSEIRHPAADVKRDLMYGSRIKRVPYSTVLAYNMKKVSRDMRY